MVIKTADSGDSVEIHENLIYGSNFARSVCLDWLSIGCFKSQFTRSESKWEGIGEELLKLQVVLVEVQAAPLR